MLCSRRRICEGRRNTVKKYVFFDFDGTLFDTAEGIVKSVQYALKKLGIDAELSELMCFAGPPLEDMFRQKYGMDEATALKAVGYFRERYKPIGWKECRPFDGVAELLTKLRQAGITIAVATSKPEYFTNAILENAGLLTAVDFVGGSLFDGTRGKKHEVIAYVLEHFGISPNEAVMVGDRMYDVDGAKKCGMDCIGVSYGYAEPGELMSHGALCVADTTQELYEILTK